MKRKGLGAALGAWKPPLRLCSGFELLRGLKVNDCVRAPAVGGLG
jgi:hypothetical protein